MATTLNFMVGALSKTEGYHWEQLMLSAFTDGVRSEGLGATQTITLIAPDGATLILEGAFNIESATSVTGTMTGFEVWDGEQQVLTADFTHTVDVEDVVGGGVPENPTIDDLIEALKVMFGSDPVTATGSPDHELIFGGLGDDTMDGGDRDERFTGFEGNDSFDGGVGGWDDVRYDVESGSMGIIVNLSDSDRTVDAVTVAGKHVRDSYGFMDSITDINFVSGTEHVDHFFGRDAKNGEFGDYPDFVIGAAGDDIFTGGNGPLGVAYDQADIENGGGKVKVNLSTKVQYGVAARHAVDTFGDTDTLQNIRNVALSQKNDTVVGGNASEHFWGRDGKDLMLGNNGKDTMEGNLGRDTLTGGKDADQFVYTNVDESKSGANQRDYITDFKHGTDNIDLAAIDANESTNKNEKFKFDDMGNKGDDVAKGHIGWYQIDKANNAQDRTIIVINVDNDKAFEMSIELKGLVDLEKGDFIL